MHSAQLPLRIPEVLQESGYSLEPELHSQPFKLKKELNGLRIREQGKRMRRLEPGLEHGKLNVGFHRAHELTDVGEALRFRK